jgi:hypothetical protein
MPGEKLTSEEAAELRRLIWLYGKEARKWEPLKQCIRRSMVYSAMYENIAKEAEQRVQTACEALHSYISQLTMKD